MVCGCCLIPLCIDNTKIIGHTCPECEELIGKWRGGASACN